jgi:phosphoesterase RecJ-like protein
MKRIDEILKNGMKIAVTGHIRPDGDCIGSVLGFRNYVLDNYKDVVVDAYLEPAGAEFSYLKGYDELIHEPKDEVYDIFFVMDCSATDRFMPFKDVFDRASMKVLMDHHTGAADFADINIVVEDESSTCELLAKHMDMDRISLECAECLYTGIIHDTGVFKYSCTHRSTMEIAGALMEKGIDTTSIIDNSFYKKTYVQNQVLGRALLESILFMDKRCIFTVIRQSEMNFYNVTSNDFSGIVEQLRLTEGVEVAVFMYEYKTGEFKVSLRSKDYVDVSKVAAAFGGGGHVRAAGFQMVGSVHDVINNISRKLEVQMK